MDVVCREPRCKLEKLTEERLQRLLAKTLICQKLGVGVDDDSPYLLLYKSANPESRIARVPALLVFDAFDRVGAMGTPDTEK